MADIRHVDEHFSVSPQLQPEDLPDLKAQGFNTIICNRPDGESETGQPTIAAMRDAAEALGFLFLALPFAGAPSPEIAAQQGELLELSRARVLAYCRSGTRSITAWALSQKGAGRADQIISKAAKAGYDLSGLRPHL